MSTISVSSNITLTLSMRSDGECLFCDDTTGLVRSVVTASRPYSSISHFATVPRHNRLCTLPEWVYWFSKRGRSWRGDSQRKAHNPSHALVYGRADCGFYCWEAVQTYEKYSCLFIMVAKFMTSSIRVRALRRQPFAAPLRNNHAHRLWCEFAPRAPGRPRGALRVRPPSAAALCPSAKPRK